MSADACVARRLAASGSNVFVVAKTPTSWVRRVCGSVGVSCMAPEFSQNACKSASRVQSSFLEVYGRAWCLDFKIVQSVAIAAGIAVLLV